ncbi:hypothetical protein DM793_03030 [Paenarthrobacter nitroguajacolicus]|uniref:TetR/AcrR family transcriptional regulator n=1 Tax=Paenarthrobacter nitroguajacolicus TaxID=211146 RepID=UPI0015B9B6EE|nr:TetR/AcrR family transcriptional regulator [Paenarthrobacter nitroguajacolicus]NWL10277.1 hypothetical protein [Paenarthrobacter nitroguajacolicus]
MRKAERTRKAALDAAANLLADQGYHRTSLEDVAGKIEMRGPSLYYYFASKDELVEAVLTAGLDEARETMTAAMAANPSANGAEMLAAAVRGYFRSIHHKSDVTRANIRCYYEVPSDFRQRLRSKMRSFIEIWEEIIETGVNDGSLRNDIEPAMASRLILAALNYTAQRRNQSATDVESMEHHLLGMVLGGFVAEDVPVGFAPSTDDVPLMRS